MDFWCHFYRLNYLVIKFNILVSMLVVYCNPIATMKNFVVFAILLAFLTVFVYSRPYSPSPTSAKGMECNRNITENDFDQHIIIDYINEKYKHNNDSLKSKAGCKAMSKGYHKKKKV